MSPDWSEYQRIMCQPMYEQLKQSLHSSGQTHNEIKLSFDILCQFFYFPLSLELAIE